MASPFAEAIMQSMTAQLDPMNLVVRQQLDIMTATSKATLQTQNDQTVLFIQKQLEDAQAKDADSSVIDYWRKRLAQLLAA